MLDLLQQIEFGPRRLPLLLQTEAAECGLACLAMTASHFGLRTDLAAMRARFSVSLKGSTLAQLMDYADRLKLSARAVQLDLDELRQLKTPCLLHWDANHFVVLRAANAKGVVLHDPAVGVRRLPYADVDKHFSGYALELTPAPGFKAVDEKRRVSVRSVLGKLTGYGEPLALVLLMSFALQAFALAAPMLNQWVVDEALVSSDRSLLNLLAIGSMVLLFTQSALSQARGWTVMYLSTHLNMQWVGNVFTHLLRLPVSWYEKRHLGDVVSRFGSVGAIQSTITSGFIAVILDGLMAIATFIMMLMYSPTLSVVVVATVLLYGAMRCVSYGPLREASMEGLMLSAKESSCFLETIRAVQAIKLFGRELDRRSRWLNAKVDSVNREVRTQKLGLWYGNINLAITGVSGTLMMWLGGGMVMDGTFTIGMLFAFAAYGAQFGARTSSLIDMFFDFKMLSLHTERLADIVLEEPEAEVHGSVSITNLDPRIELLNVGFRYSDGDPWVVRNLNLVIEPGDSLALVGPSGGGKTTLIKLILGVLTPLEGEIRYGGVPVRQLGARSYRSALGAVMQEDQLLAGSLRENISFFDQPTDTARVEVCAKIAAVHADIAAMPMGYETLAGDMGSSLSGGQKQRVLLARALYKQPRVLVLDEATSHLDVTLERHVNAAIAALPITRIIVAHRPETIASARRVIALVDGKLKEATVAQPDVGADAGTGEAGQDD
ncbi:MAG: peptidase domain-containing ABC transporter [Pseudomonadota bacterium]